MLRVITVLFSPSKVRESEAKCVIDKLRTEKSKDVYKDKDAKSLSVLNLKVLYR